MFLSVFNRKFAQFHLFAMVPALRPPSVRFDVEVWERGRWMIVATFKRRYLAERYANQQPAGKFGIVMRIERSVNFIDRGVRLLENLR